MCLEYAKKRERQERDGKHVYCEICLRVRENDAKDRGEQFQMGLSNCGLLVG